MRHWAAPLIGKRWRLGATGPDEFDCWGLVQHVFKIRHGFEMPYIEHQTRENFTNIRIAAKAGGWRTVDAPPQNDDIVMMRSVSKLHCGVVVSALSGLGVLHCIDGAGVVWEKYADATQGMTAEIWRRHP